MINLCSLEMKIWSTDVCLVDYFSMIFRNFWSPITMKCLEAWHIKSSVLSSFDLGQKCCLAHCGWDFVWYPPQVVTSHDIKWSFFRYEMWLYHVTSLRYYIHLMHTLHQSKKTSQHSSQGGTITWTWYLPEERLVYQDLKQDDDSLLWKCAKELSP
jgi:hypothetical protein